MLAIFNLIRVPDITDSGCWSWWCVQTENKTINQLSSLFFPCSVPWLLLPGCWLLLGTNRHIKFILNLNQWLGPEKLLGASSHWIYEMVFSKMCITTKYYRGKISIFKFELLMPAADAGNWCPPVSKCRWISGSLSLSLSLPPSPQDLLLSSCIIPEMFQWWSRVIVCWLLTRGDSTLFKAGCWCARGQESAT